MTGTLYGVGVGPGDPELVTVKAARLITAAAVVAYHGAGPGRSLARASAAPYLRDGQLEEALLYPVTSGETDHPGGYAGAIADFYAESADRLARHLDTGRDVVLLAEGDPTLFSSYMHMHKRLADRYRCVIVPGVSSVSAAAAAAGTPLVEGNEVLTVLPATLPAGELADRLAGTDAAAILKVSRNVGAVTEALSPAQLQRARCVQRASHTDEQVAALSDVDAGAVPYMSTVIVPGPVASGGPRPERASAGVAVVGLGPAGGQWLTPQARAELAAAEHVVGYATYLDRVPVTPGQQRHATDNRVEAERAEFALDLARRGSRVVVVSSGDPGVFAMASAVLQVRADRGYDDVAVQVIPGLTAASAVASRVGAPLGHDFCVLSLSDQLKPWQVIADRLAAAAAADLVIALYNPASRTRRRQLDDACDILLRYRKPDTPVVVGRAVGTPTERVEVVTLAELDTTTVDMRTLLIIGSSRTRVHGDTVFTPRDY